MISNEENARGAPSMFHKGNRLKQSLIDPDKVKNFLANNVLNLN